MQVDQTVTIRLDADERFPIERRGESHQVARVHYDSESDVLVMQTHDGTVIGTGQLADIGPDGRDVFPYDVRRALYDAVSGPPMAGA